MGPFLYAEVIHYFHVFLPTKKIKIKITVTGFHRQRPIRKDF